MVMAEDAITVNAKTVEATIAAPAVEAVQKKEATILVSPRTGMRYTVNNPSNIPIIFKTELIAPATTTNANRIVANNPALSVESQQKAQAALLALVTSNSQQTPPLGQDVVAQDTVVPNPAVQDVAVSESKNLDQAVIPPSQDTVSMPTQAVAEQNIPDQNVVAPITTSLASATLPSVEPLAATEQPAISMPGTTPQATSTEVEAVVEKADTAQ